MFNFVKTRNSKSQRKNQLLTTASYMFGLLSDYVLRPANPACENEEGISGENVIVFSITISPLTGI
jgi:hypothetical protein